MRGAEPRWTTISKLLKGNSVITELCVWQYVVFNEYYKSGETFREALCVNGKYHNDDGPAVVTYYKSGKIRTKTWIHHGLYHRICGPSKIFYDESGQILSEEWFLRNKQIHPEEWLEENGYKWPLTNEQQTELLLMFK